VTRLFAGHFLLKREKFQARIHSLSMAGGIMHFISRLVRCQKRVFFCSGRFDVSPSHAPRRRGEGDHPNDQSAAVNGNQRRQGRPLDAFSPFSFPAPVSKGPLPSLGRQSFSINSTAIAKGKSRKERCVDLVAVAVAAVVDRRRWQGRRGQS